jgi:hypothetical protein
VTGAKLPKAAWALPALLLAGLTRAEAPDRASFRNNVRPDFTRLGRNRCAGHGNGGSPDSRCELRLRRGGTYSRVVNDPGGPAHVYRLSLRSSLGGPAP